MLEEKRLFILDMDGTVYLGDRLFPQTLPFLKRIKAMGGEYIFFTNNASRSRQTYESRLASMGIPATPDEIMTSGDVTIQFLKTYRARSKVLLLGTPDLEQSFRQAGVELVEDDPDIVLVSFDTGVTYEKLDRACHYVRNGAEFLSTHPDVRQCGYPAREHCLRARLSGSCSEQLRGRRLSGRAGLLRPVHL